MKLGSRLSKFWNNKISRKRRKVIFRPPFSYDYTFKIVLLGEPGVEKTALAQKFCLDLFSPSERLVRSERKSRQRLDATSLVPLA